MKLFNGVMTALVTPFQNGELDEKALRTLVDWQIESGIHGLVPCGTTGESATLTLYEKMKVIDIVLEQAKERVPVIAGTGSNNTRESVELTTWAKTAGVNGVLAVTPYYNKPSQAGLIKHYTAIADVGVPVVLYNVPSRTALSLSLNTISELSRHSHIVAIKEATASMDFATQILASCDSTFTLISGDDFTYLPFLSVGGKGVISVLSNVAPRSFVELHDSFMKGNLEKAQSIHHKLYPLMKDLFIDTNPVPVKTALSMMKKITFDVRLPLCEMTRENQDRLQATLKSQELIA